MLSYRHEGRFTMLIYVNGSWVQEAEAVVPFKDQGFLYGDSLFETIRINSGKPFRLQKHLARMLGGMQTIYMDGHTVLESIPDLLINIIQKNRLNNALVRVMVTRGVTQDSSQETDSSLALYLSARKVTIFTEWPVKVIFVEEKDYPLLRFYPAIKSGNYLGNMLAKKDAEKAGAFEPVFINNDGYVTECAIRNIFFIKGNTLLTPHVELGVLPGVIRDTIMELARKRGFQVEESFTRIGEVNDMDEAFISSTGVGVLPVTWDGFQSTYERSQILRTDLQTLFDSGAQNVT